MGPAVLRRLRDYFVPAAHLIDSQPVALTLMLAVAAAMVLHTLRYEAQAITTIAFLLAFATVTLHHDSVYSLAAGAVLALRSSASSACAAGSSWSCWACWRPS